MTFFRGAALIENQAQLATILWELFHPRGFVVSDKNVGAVNVVVVAFFYLIPDVKIGFAVVSPEHGDLFPATSDFVIWVMEVVLFDVAVLEFHGLQK